MYAAHPCASFGYYRGTPYFKGEGSGMGEPVAGSGKFASGTGATVSGVKDTWHPTIMYLFGLILAEMVVFGILSRHV